MKTSIAIHVAMFLGAILFMTWACWYVLTNPDFSTTSRAMRAGVIALAFTAYLHSTVRLARK